MTEKRLKLGHLLYGIMLSLILVALGVCFILSCLDIYRSAESAPFTPEAIKSHFLVLLIPTVVCILTIVGGVCLNIFLPKEEPKLRANITDKDIIKNLSKRINYKEAPKELVAVVKSQRGFRCAFLIITFLNAIINGAYMILYVLSMCLKEAKPNPDLFAEFFPIFATALSYAIIPIFVIVIYHIFAKFTYARELEAVRAISEYNAKKGVPVSNFEESTCFFKKHKKAFKNILRGFILTLSIALIVVSIIFFDDFKEIASLAGDNVCAGCIGLF